MQLLARIPWVGRVWALPFLTVLAPSQRYHEQRGIRHKKLTDWARQMILQLRRWLPNRVIVVVADSSYAALELLARCRSLLKPVTMVTRLRLDAALYDPPPPRVKPAVGRPRLKGKRQPTLQARLVDPQTEWQRVKARWYGGSEREIEVATGTAIWYHGGMPPVPIRWVFIRDPEERFEPQALLCTDQTVSAQQIVEWFVLRWQLEVTLRCAQGRLFHEVRAHLGVETQRQWSELAIARTTPALLGLFSLVTLAAREFLQQGKLPTRQAAWYAKPLPTFVDTLALVRQQLWPVAGFHLSPNRPDVAIIPRPLLERRTETLAFPA